MASLLQKILFNDWSFLLDKSVDNGKSNKYQPAFDTIFRTDGGDEKNGNILEVLQFLALIKPENCNINLDQSEFEEIVNPVTVTTIYKFIF